MPTSFIVNSGKIAKITTVSEKDRVVRYIPKAKAHLMVAKSGTHPLFSNIAVMPGNRAPVPRLAHSATTMHIRSPLLRLSAADNWTQAVKAAFDHVTLVVANNPGKTLTQILERPDVQEALHDAGLQGAEAVMRQLRATWIATGAPEDSNYLTQVLSDVSHNGASLADRLTESLSHADRSKVEATLLKDRLRASAAESVLRTRGEAEAAIERFRAQGIKRIKWQARKIPGTEEFEPTVCTACRELDGTKVDIGKSFNVNVLKRNKLKQYGGRFILPPAHPNCKCVVVPA